MHKPSPIDRLPSLATPAGELPLAGWYADPLTPGQARELAGRIKARWQERDSGCEPFTLELLMMIARWWQGEAIEAEARRLQRIYPSPALRGLVHEVFGQLLISRKLSGAGRMLDEALQQLSAELAPADYFSLLKRHQALSRLHLGNRPALPQPLQALLNEAAAIEAIEGPRRPNSGPGRQDTTG
jgi:hypothetical protein